MDRTEAIEIIEREIEDIENNSQDIYSDEIYEFVEALHKAVESLKHNRPVFTFWKEFVVIFELLIAGYGLFTDNLTISYMGMFMALGGALIMMD